MSDEKKQTFFDWVAVEGGGPLPCLFCEAECLVGVSTPLGAIGVICGSCAGDIAEVVDMYRLMTGEDVPPY